MNVAKRALAAILVTAGALAGGAAATGAPAQASPWHPDGPRLLVVAPGVVHQHTPQWVQAYWLGTETVCDFRLTADAPGVDVGYPANTATYTSFYRNASLDRLEPDRTALHLEAHRAGTLPLRLHMAYTHRAADGTCGTKVRHHDLTVRLSVLPA